MNSVKSKVKFKTRKDSSRGFLGQKAHTRLLLVVENWWLRTRRQIGQDQTMGKPMF